jgi:hypothetical protein
MKSSKSKSGDAGKSSGTDSKKKGTAQASQPDEKSGGNKASSKRSATGGEKKSTPSTK